MTISVLGMHRSGTSMIARLLNLCGMHLGNPEDIMEPHSIDNPDGYWENTRIVAINDAILEHFGGTDQWPPEMAPGWTADPNLGQVRSEASELISEMEGMPVWGWKDPRTMLTLPFWQNLLPDTKCLLVYRNPLEVAMSLGKRQDYVDAYYSPNLHHSLYLWTHYHVVALESLPQNTIVCSYEAFFTHPEVELKRVLEALGLDVSEETVAEAAKHINPDLRRNRIDESFLHEHFVPDEARKIYRDLEAKAGVAPSKEPTDPLPTYRKLMPIALKQLSAQSHMVRGSKEITGAVQDSNRRLVLEIERHKDEAARLRSQVETQLSGRRELEAKFRDYQAAKRDLDNRLRELQLARQDLLTQVNEKTKQATLLRDQLTREVALKEHMINTHQRELHDLAHILRHRPFFERLLNRLRSR